MISECLPNLFGTKRLGCCCCSTISAEVFVIFYEPKYTQDRRDNTLNNYHVII
jgi:hypothetical protein